MARGLVGCTVPNSRWWSVLLSEEGACPSFHATYGPAGLFTENSLLNLAVLFEAQRNIISQEMGKKTLQKKFLSLLQYMCVLKGTVLKSCSFYFSLISRPMPLFIAQGK